MNMFSFILEKTNPPLLKCNIIYPAPVRDCELCFRVAMFKAGRKSATTSNSNLGKEEAEADEMLLRAVKRKQMTNKVERKDHVEAKRFDKVERSAKVEKRTGLVVPSIGKTRRRVVLNNSAGNWSGSSTEEESDNGEDLANVEQDLAEVRVRLARLQEEKLASPGGITETGSWSAWEERSSQSDEEEFFGIDQEGKAVALSNTPSKVPGSSRPELDCLIVEESTTEEESENEESPRSDEFGEGPGRGKQVNFLCSRWE